MINYFKFYHKIIKSYFNIEKFRIHFIHIFLIIDSFHNLKTIQNMIYSNDISYNSDLFNYNILLIVNPSFFPIKSILYILVEKIK